MIVCGDALQIYIGLHFQNIVNVIDNGIGHYWPIIILVGYFTSCLLEEHTNTFKIGGEQCLNMQITQRYAFYTKLCLQRSRIPLTEDIDCTPQYPPSNTFVLFILIFSFINNFFSSELFSRWKEKKERKSKLRGKDRTTGHMALIHTMGSTRTLGHYVYFYCLLICAKCQLLIHY